MVPPGSRRRTTDAPGVGLGLVIGQPIVERHGGRIAVESPPDGGGLPVHLPLVT